MREFEKDQNAILQDKLSSSDQQLQVWDTLKESNTSNPKDIQKAMKSFGYSRGEIEEFLKLKLPADKKDKIEQFKDEAYLRHKLRYRLLMDHVKDSNLLITLDHM